MYTIYLRWYGTYSPHVPNKAYIAIMVNGHTDQTFLHTYSKTQPVAMSNSHKCQICTNMNMSPNCTYVTCFMKDATYVVTGFNHMTRSNLNIFDTYHWTDMAPTLQLALNSQKQTLLHGHIAQHICMNMLKHKQLQCLFHRLFPNMCQEQISPPNWAYIQCVFTYTWHIWSHCHQPYDKESCTHIWQISMNKHGWHIGSIAHIANMPHGQIDIMFCT